MNSEHDRLVEFVRTLHDRAAAYHDHKESMAYAGFTLFLGLVAAGLLTDSWVAVVKKYPQYSAQLSVVLLWAAVLTYLKFQLIRRRWAALRVAGCERLLARWALRDATAEEVQLATKSARGKVHWFKRGFDWLVPIQEAVRAVDADQTVYPSGLVDELCAREVAGTAAIKHERLIVIMGWVLFSVLLWRVSAAAV